MENYKVDMLLEIKHLDDRIKIMTQYLKSVSSDDITDTL